MSLEKKYAKKRLLSQDQAKADAAHGVFGTDTLPGPGPTVPSKVLLLQPKTEPEEREIFAVQVKVEEVEVETLSGPSANPPLVSLGKIKQEEDVKKTKSELQTVAEQRNTENTACGKTEDSCTVEPNSVQGDNEDCSDVERSQLLNEEQRSTMEENLESNTEQDITGETRTDK